MNYYTLRKAGSPSQPTYELTKWEVDRPHPTEVYVQWIEQRGDGSMDVTSCNCPSRQSPCKHASISEELLCEAAPFNNLYALYWEEGKVKPAFDLPSTEHVRKLLS